MRKKEVRFFDLEKKRKKFFPQKTPWGKVNTEGWVLIDSRLGVEKTVGEISPRGKKPQRGKWFALKKRKRPMKNSIRPMRPFFVLEKTEKRGIRFTNNFVTRFWLTFLRMCFDEKYSSEHESSIHATLRSYTRVTMSVETAKVKRSILKKTPNMLKKSGQITVMRHTTCSASV
jgi:hypothetical protein